MYCGVFLLRWDIDAVPERNSPDEGDDLDQLADGAQLSLVREFRDFLCHNKKWWLIPIVVTLLVLSLFVILSGTAYAPFIYTLF